MPYYSVGRMLSEADSTNQRMLYGDLPQGGKTLLKGSHELGFRTLVPHGDVVKEIALNVAEPYSWWMDYQAIKIRALEKRVDFDTTLLRQDRGHTWDFEQYTIDGVHSFSWIASGEPYQSRNVVPFRGVSPVPAAILPSSSIDTWAALQYGRMAPVVGEFSLSTFMGELREGLPRLIPDILSRAKTAKAAGSDYLNLEFGWKPLIQDLQGLADSFLHASFGLFRPLGATHRRRERPSIDLFDRVDYGVGAIQSQFGNLGSIPSYNPFPSTPSSYAATGATGLGSISYKSTLKQWVEGEFVYIPKAGFDPSSFLDRYETLANVDLTPAALWELAPWSWLVDWAGQIGQSLSAMEAGISNRVLSTYYYGMEDSSSTIRSSVTVTGNQPGMLFQGPVNMTTTVKRRRRRRIRANPFGYTGSSSTALNVQQMAILGALGLTRSK